MIKGISQTGRYITVSGGNPMSTYIPPGNQSAGILRYNIATNNVEVYDGSMWKELSVGYASVSLTGEAEVLLDWAKRKMLEEEGMLILPSDHPAVKIAKQNINRAKQAVKEAEEQLKITEILSQDETTS
jgi:hypothetical protein